MMSLKSAEIAQILDGELQGAGDLVLSEVFTDTRNTCQNGLFFALKGEKFDAHQYLAQAIEQGAKTLVVERFNPEISAPQIKVENTRLALGKLGAWIKSKILPKTVAITGSCGKTSVKEMTANILKAYAKRLNLTDDAVLFTAGNLNNDLGVPLTLCRLTEKTKFAVIELGANHQGEIAYTTHLVKPDIALVNNFANAHLAGFGSLAGVAQAKGEIFQGLNEQGLALINAENVSPHWQFKTQNVQSFGFNNNADYRAEKIALFVDHSRFELITPFGKEDITLAYAGKHNVSNALAASAIALNMGANFADIKQGLSQKMGVKGRLYFEQFTKNLCVIDDCYNANVASMIAAIDVLKAQQGKRILVLGDMGELGEESEACHRQVGEKAHLAHLEAVFTFGEEAKVISDQCKNGKHFPKIAAEDLIDELMTLIAKEQQTTILFKGSRSMKMENLIQLLKEKVQC